MRPCLFAGEPEFLNELGDKVGPTQALLTGQAPAGTCQFGLLGDVTPAPQSDQDAQAKV